ncbi:MAG: MBL fold metallo-hydrolase [Bacteroidales bacterium]|nr:MBL fold metallo-hydrolase [Bacteroidales bacterium]
MSGILICIGIIVVGAIIFLNRPSFGRTARGDRKARIEKSPNYKNGAFKNELPIKLMTIDGNMLTFMWEMAFRKNENVTPKEAVPAIKTDLSLLPEENLIVWFGHSSYLLQLSGKKILVDPVFERASPVRFFNKPFRGTDIYHAEDMPDIDYLIISHDHWDHLDYQTVKELRDKVKKVIVPLGVGEYFEYWGFAPDQIIEMDWHETTTFSDGFDIYCLPAQHYSRRGLKGNQTLWASFLIQTPEKEKVYLGGDSGYGTHFKKIGEQFHEIDFAVLENGQYNNNWNQIHALPQQLQTEIAELNAKQVITVHHSKYSLARHSWDEPLKTERQLAEQGVNMLILTIGKPEKIME